MATQDETSDRANQPVVVKPTTLSVPEKMNRVCDFIQKHTAQTGFSPSIRQIADGCDFSLNSTFRYLGKLEDQGRVIRIPGQARSIRVVDDQAAEAKSNSDRSVDQPPRWCDGRLCRLLSEQSDILDEFMPEEGVSA